MAGSRYRSGFGAALAAVALLAAGACGSGPPEGGYDNVSKPSFDPNGAPPSTPPTTVQRASYTPTYVKQDKCKVKDVKGMDPNEPTRTLLSQTECGILTVPQDRTDPSTDKIDLQVVRIRSTNPAPAPDPMVYLEGGPGGSALVNIDRWAKYFAPVLKNRDLIIMDQRGTGYSEPTITCVFDEESAGDSVSTLEIMDKCHERIAGDAPLSAYNTVQNAADFADLRVAMGIDQWNLMGISYGTRLALQMMNDAPTGIRSVIIDSVLPAEASYFNERPADAVRAFQAVFNACAADPSCASANPDLETKLADIVDALNRQPASTGLAPYGANVDKRLVFEGGTFLNVMFSLLYDSDAIQIVPSLITCISRDPSKAVRILGGDPSLPWCLGEFEGEPYVPRRATRSALSDGFFFTVMCAEEAPKANPADMEGRIPPVNDIIRNELIAGVNEDLEICKLWDVPASPVTDPVAPIPTMVVAGSFDPITPPSWAQMAQAKLPVSRYLEVEGAGHGVYLASPCVRDQVDTFLADPASLGGTDGCPSLVKFQQTG